MLEKLAQNTYVINHYNKIGIYLVNEKDVVVIDTGLDDRSGQNILDICNENNWNILMIINTHSHIDHVGGNNIIQKTLNIPIYAYGIERTLIQNPEISSAISYGGYPHKYLNNKYLIAQKSNVQKITNEILPIGLEVINLPGHNEDVIGIKTSDNIYFLSDSLAGEDIIKKYKIQFVYNVKEYYKTLDYLKKLKGKLFVPGHGNNFIDIKEVVELNKKASLEIINNIKKKCQKPKSFDQILKSIFDIYNLKMDIVQHAYIGTTIKCYLSYMINEKMLKIEIKDNVLLWITT